MRKLFERFNSGSRLTLNSSTNSLSRYPASPPPEQDAKLFILLGTTLNDAVQLHIKHPFILEKNQDAKLWIDDVDSSTRLDRDVPVFLVLALRFLSCKQGT